MHKYNFYGKIRTYKNKLTLIDGVVYLGTTDILIDHWAVTPKKIEQFDNWPVLQKAKKGQRLIYLADKRELHFKSSKSKDYFHKILGVNEVEFIGETNYNFAPNIDEKAKNKIYRKHHVTATGLFCCYCECELFLCSIQIPTLKTRDHIIPKHKSGKVLKWCCHKCNNEKGGMELPVYIQYLCYQQSKVRVKSTEYVILQTKIINANEIAKSLSLD
jgi:hypothetical protein